MGKMALLLGGAVGAGAVYFVNSKRGSKTSSFSPSQAGSFVQQTAQQVQSKASGVASTAAGAIKKQTTDVVATVQNQASSAAGTVKNQASSAAGTVKNQASSAAGTVQDQASSAVEGAKEQASSSTGAGTGTTTQQSGNQQPDNPNPDDNTLRDRVEIELFRRAWVPKGNLNIDVVDGVVELRGQLKHQTDIDTLIKDARAVQHVKDVRSFLHLPGTPAPNKESAIEAS